MQGENNIKRVPFMEERHPWHTVHIITKYSKFMLQLDIKYRTDLKLGS